MLVDERAAAQPAPLMPSVQSTHKCQSAVIREVCLGNKDWYRFKRAAVPARFFDARRALLKMMLHQQKRAAFSLMELLAVVTILGILAALILPRVVNSSDTAKDKTCFHNRAEINITVEQYYLHTGSWPANDLSDIGADSNYFPDGLPMCPVSGQAYRLDPATHRLVGHESSSDHSP